MHMLVLLYNDLQHYTPRTSFLVLKGDVRIRVLYNITGKGNIKLSILTYIPFSYILFQNFPFNISVVLFYFLFSLSCSSLGALKIFLCFCFGFFYSLIEVSI
jgi:hypothetical protein